MSFENNYIKSFSRFIKASNEKQQIVLALNKYLANRDFKNCLDCGCGDLSITNQLIKHCDHVYAIDNKKHFDGDAPSDVNYNQVDIFDFETNKKFDFILTCFLLWEIDFTKWDNLFDKWDNMLSKEGKVIIIDSLDSEKHNNPFFNFNIPFNNKGPDLYKFLELRNYKIDSYYFNSQISENSCEDLYETLAFFFLDDKKNTWYKENKNIILNDLESKKEGSKYAVNIPHCMYVVGPR